MGKIGVKNQESLSFAQVWSLLTMLLQFAGITGGGALCLMPIEIKCFLEINAMRKTVLSVVSGHPNSIQFC